MAYDPRTIAFFVELLHLPVRHSSASLQALHGELFGDPQATYKNFALVPGGARFSNPASSNNVISSATLLGDRVQIREELTGISLEDFCGRLERFGEVVQSRAGVVGFTAQQCVVRSLINPRQFKDSRHFLAKGVFRFTNEDMNAFGRPSQLLGLRVVFPKSPGNEEVFSLRLESYNMDPRSVYVENVGTFAPLPSGNEMVPLAENLKETYRFLTEEGLQFLSRFDHQPEKSE